MKQQKKKKHNEQSRAEWCIGWCHSAATDGRTRTEQVGDDSEQAAAVSALAWGHRWQLAMKPMAMTI